MMIMTMKMTMTMMLMVVVMMMPRQEAEAMTDPKNKVRNDIEMEGEHIKWHFVFPTVPR